MYFSYIFPFAAIAQVSSQSESNNIKIWARLERPWRKNIKIIRYRTVFFMRRCEIVRTEIGTIRNCFRTHCAVKCWQRQLQNWIRFLHATIPFRFAALEGEHIDPGKWLIVTPLHLIWYNQLKRCSEPTKKLLALLNHFHRPVKS